MDSSVWTWKETVSNPGELSTKNELIPASTSEISRVGDGKKIYQVEYLQEEQLIIVLAGRHRQMRLIPIRALDQTETEWIKVADTKNCIGNH